MHKNIQVIYMIEGIRNYLVDNKDNINISGGNIYINNYTKLNTINEKSINIEFKDKYIYITGENFVITKLLDKEVLFYGNPKKVEIYYK